MPVVWIDPFIGGSSTSTDWGAGTTSNTTRDGSYASPFKFEDWRSNTNSTSNAVNGQTIAADTEIRIKGKTIADMFMDVGDIYFTGNSSSPKLKATDTSVGSTQHTFASNSANYSLATYNCIISGTRADVINATPTGFAPMIQGYRYTNNWDAILSYGIRIDNNAHEPLASVFHNAVSSLDASQRTYGYLKAMKVSVQTAITQTLANGDGNYWFNQNNLIKISAGWTSETEQNGYSYMRIAQSDSYEYQRFRGNNVVWDCARLGMISTSTRMRWYIYLNKSGAHHKFGYVNFNGTNVDCYVYQNGASTAEFGTITNKVRISTNGTANTLKLHNLWVARLYLEGSGSAAHKVQIGNVYYNYIELSDNQKGLIHRTSSNGYATVEFLSNSAYLAAHHSGVSTNSYITIPPADLRALTANNAGTTPPTYIYGTGLRAGGNASGTWLDDVTLDVAPNCGGVISADAAGIYSQNADYYSSDWWTSTGLDLAFLNTNKMFKHVVPCGKLQLNGSDYRTNDTTITSLQNYGFSSVATNYQPMIFGFETNDYDQKPIAFMTPDGSTGKCAIAFNETVSSTEYLVLKTGGGTGSYIYPVEVPVPSHTAGTNNIRLKIRCYHHTGATSASIRMYAFYRKDDNDNDYAYVQGDALDLVSLNSDSSSPRVSYLNIPLSASGVREINSIMCYLKFSCTTTSHNNRVYVEYVVAETY